MIATLVRSPFGSDIRVPLTTEDHERVREFMEDIVRVKEPDGYRRVPWPACRHEAWYTSKLAELAFSKHFGWPVDWSIYEGGDGKVDFVLVDGSTVDVKSVEVHTNLLHDFTIPMKDGEVVCDWYVQVLVPREQSFADITGLISADEFFASCRLQTEWDHRGDVRPQVVHRSQLSQEWPDPFLWNVMP